MEETIDLREYFSILKKKMWLIGLIKEENVANRSISNYLWTYKWDS